MYKKIVEPVWFWIKKQARKIKNLFIKNS